MTLINCHFNRRVFAWSQFQLRAATNSSLIAAYLQLREAEDLQPRLVIAAAGVFTIKGWFQQSC